MANMTSLLTATITGTDVGGKTPINKDIGSPSFPGKTGDLTSYQESAVAAPITLPVTPAQCVYIKNLAAAGSGVTLSVAWTPNGGAAVGVVTVLGPKGVLLLWNQEFPVIAAMGISALTLTPSALCQYEYYIGG
jgi:hypothetical protein